MLKLETKPLNLSQTKKLARVLALEIKKEMPLTKKAVVFGLTGILGAGKTSFIRMLAKELGIKEKVISPSFLIQRKYKFIIRNSKFRIHRPTLIHIDCYRIKGPKDLKIIDLKTEVEDHKNLILIEWAEKVKKLMPKNAIWLKIKVRGEKRQFIFQK